MPVIVELLVIQQSTHAAPLYTPCGHLLCRFPGPSYVLVDPVRQITQQNVLTAFAVHHMLPLTIQRCLPQPCRTLSDPAPARYAHKAAAAGSFISSSGKWQVVQPAQPGMQQLQYRLLTGPGVLPQTMWYV